MVHDHGQRLPRGMLLGIQDHVVPRQRAGPLLPGPPVLGSKDYINLRLTGKIFTDYSYASGSGIYDLMGWRYSQEFIRASGLLHPLSANRAVHANHRHAQRGGGEELGLPRGVKVACGAWTIPAWRWARATRRGKDVHVAGIVFVDRGFLGEAGPGSEGEALRLHARHPGAFHLRGEHLFGGSSFRWIRDALMGGEAVPGGRVARDAYEVMNELAASSPVGAHRLLFNPSLAGGSSQEPSPHIRGAFAGIDLRHTRGDLIRAGMEGIAMNLGAVLEVLRRFVPLAPQMLMVGGGSKSALWRQIFADIYGMECVKTNVDQEAGSLGAAAVAAVGAGLWKSFDAVDGVHKVRDVSKPIPGNVEKYRNSCRPLKWCAGSRQSWESCCAAPISERRTLTHGHVSGLTI